MRLACRRMVGGVGRGLALKSDAPIGLMGDIDAATGQVIGEVGGLCGRCLAGAVLVVPYTVGSGGAWRVLYQLGRRGVAPAAIVLARPPGPTLVQGAILAQIPVVRLLDAAHFACIPPDLPIVVDADRQLIGVDN